MNFQLEFQSTNDKFLQFSKNDNKKENLREKRVSFYLN